MVPPELISAMCWPTVPPLPQPNPITTVPGINLHSPPSPPLHPKKVRCQEKFIKHRFIFLYKGTLYWAVLIWAWCWSTKSCLKCEHLTSISQCIDFAVSYFYRLYCAVFRFHKTFSFFFSLLLLPFMIPENIYILYNIEIDTFIY